MKFAIIWTILVSLALAAEPNKRYYDFNFVATDIGAVLQAIATTAGVDIVPSPEVSGTKIDLKVTKKSWQEALDIICQTYELTWLVEDKYISIQKTSTWQAKQLKAAEKKEQGEQLGALVRKNFQIRHAKANDLVDVIRSMTSSRGKITVVDRSNSIIVYDNEVRVAEMGKALEELDVETQQVLITAKLVVLDSKVAQEMGVDWSVKGGTGAATAGGEIPVEGSIYDSRSQLALSSNPGLGKAPAGGQVMTMSLFDNKLGMNIYNLIGEGRGEILASPQISTLDHEEAKIFMGDKISIRIVDATGQSSTQLVESGIKLTVTPHITGDNRIMLELKPENNSYSYDDKGQPVISTQDAETKVVVADGETVVIGGLTKNIETESETGIPFLKDIPVLGYLFKYYKKEVTKKDLIIFVTPRILRTQAQEVKQLNSGATAEAVPVKVEAKAPVTETVQPKTEAEVNPVTPTTAPETPTNGDEWAE